MATQLLRKGQNPVVFLGTNEVALASLPWKAVIVRVFAVNDSGQGYASGNSASSFGVTSFKPRTDGSLAGYIVVTSEAVQVDATLFKASGAVSAFPLDASLSAPVGSQPVYSTIVEVYGERFQFNEDSIKWVGGSGVLLASLNKMPFVSLAEFNSQMNTAPSHFFWQLQLQHTGAVQVTLTLTPYA